MLILSQYVSKIHFNIKLNVTGNIDADEVKIANFIDTSPLLKMQSGMD
jgi:hypothetical protein